MRAGAHGLGGRPPGRALARPGVRHTIRARHFGKDILAGLKNLVGGEIEKYTKLMAEAREQAIDRMVAQAAQRGANAIINVRVGTSYIMGSASEILAYGEAVAVEKL